MLKFPYLPEVKLYEVRNLISQLYRKENGNTAQGP